MKIRFGVWWFSAALALTAAIAPAMADQWNKETRLEINEPLEIPGKVLLPGKYVFRLADSPTNRHIVQVFSVDADGRERFVTTILANAAYEMDTPDKPIIRLEERRSGSPQAIHAWFYPGDNFGIEFAYPKSERLQVSDARVPAPEPAPVPAAVAPLPDPPVEAVVSVPPVELPVENLAISEPDETPVLIPDTIEEPRGDADRMLPETAGYTLSALMAGLAMLALGLVTVSVGVCRSEA